MPNKNFTNFEIKTSISEVDYIVGYKEDGTAEYRTTFKDLVNYLKPHLEELIFSDTLPSDPAPFSDASFTWTAAPASLSAGAAGFTMSDNGSVRLLSDLTGYLKLSNNSGATWSAITNAPANSWGSVCMSANGNYMLACRAGGAYLSNNGGVTWTSVAREGIACAMSYGGRVQILGGGSNVYVSTNYGTTWFAASIRATSTGPGAVSVSKDGSTCLVCAEVGSNKFLYVSRDSGTTWTQTTAPTGGEYRAVTCGSKDGSVMYAVKFFGDYRCIKSTDYGQTWTDASTTQLLGGYAVFTSYQGKYVVVTCRYARGVYVSKDYGATWTQYRNGTDLSGGSISYNGKLSSYVDFGTNAIYVGQYS